MRTLPQLFEAVADMESSLDTLKRDIQFIMDRQSDQVLLDNLYSLDNQLHYMYVNLSEAKKKIKLVQLSDAYVK
jgi:regulator of replication initiation timing